MWFANQTWDGKNLTVTTGQSLPKIWQKQDKINYLKKQYGNDCVVWKEDMSINIIPENTDNSVTVTKEEWKEFQEYKKKKKRK